MPYYSQTSIYNFGGYSGHIEYNVAENSKDKEQVTDIAKAGVIVNNDALSQGKVFTRIQNR